MSGLSDQLERDRFVAEQEKNISVIAPAGVGKTHAIVERIAHLARQPEAVERLARLIVVTYSVRAAQEMQQRARAAMRAMGVSSRVHRAFQQTFFGTIHSYCVRLLDRFGHYLGLPSPVALLEADDELWNRFLLRGLGHGIVSDPGLRELFHFYAPEKLYALAKEIAPGEETGMGPMPALELFKLFDYRDDSLHSATKKSIANAQLALKQWSEAWARGDRFQSLPKCPESEKAAAFAEIWSKTFAPLHDWLRDAALVFGRHVANAYESFRLSEAVMTYDDQVRLALRVLEHPAVQKELRAERLSVLLDEAQDTDPRQFEVLLRVAGLRDARPEDQSFCIVGDFQQAIYAPRSDLAVYRNVHEEVSAEPRGTSSRLQVTFRCDHAVIEFVNQVFPTILNGANGQCSFVELAPRPHAGPGQVVRWGCPGNLEQSMGKKIKAEVRARHEAQFLAQEIKKLGPAGFGADDWSQVAILCPRRQWLREIGRELVAVGLPVQLHSSNETLGDRAPWAWLTSLIWIAAHPEDSFEITGVLREIFGVSDHDIATYTKGDGEKLRLDRFKPSGEGAVENVLIILQEACVGADTLPLHQFVQKIAGETCLRERLNAIASLELENADRELDDFIALILERCAAGTILAELADELRRSLVQIPSGTEEVTEAIQLMTSHKAKGLEWRVVVVPFVFRTIESKSLPYPRLVLDGDRKERVFRDKVDFAAGAKDFVQERERQQLQRLLYVMCTRARHTVLFLDDESLFSGATRRSGWSMAELLNFSAGANRTVWKALPEKLVSFDPPNSEESSHEAFRYSLPELSRGDITWAVKNATTFPHRVTPHALALHRGEDAEPERQAERGEDRLAVSVNHPGILYGTWWHEFVESIPWQQPIAAWQQKFMEALPGSPQPERSQQEWEIFSGSSLARWLAEPKRLIQVEVPFLWLDANKQCIEGVMDLAVYSPDESSWRVLDWKTNRLGTMGGADLVEIYREQIRAYVKVLREMHSVEVRGSLYVTQTGDWLEVE